MGLFKKAKKAVGKIAKPFVKAAGKFSDKFIPNELRPFLPYASMFLPASGILGAMGGPMGFAKMYGANMLTQAMGDPEAEFEDLNQLSGILSGLQGGLSGANTAGNLRGSTTQGGLDSLAAAGTPVDPGLAEGVINNRSLLTKAADLGKNIAAGTSDYLTGNIDTLQDLGSGRAALNFENIKDAGKALAFDAAKATGDVAVNLTRPAIREFEKFEADEAADIERTTTANESERAGLQMTFMRQANIGEDKIQETLDMNDLGEYYTPPTESAAYGGLMGRNNYEFGGITEALMNAGSRGLMTENRAMGGMMGNDKTYHQYHDQTVPMDMESMMGYNMGGSVLPRGMEMDYRGGGFIPMGSKERADDVPARVSKNEFVMTADAVRAAGGGSVNKGAKKMYDLMNNLEARA